MSYSTNLTEGKYIGDVLRSEVLPEHGYCRKELTIKDSVAVDFGSVLHVDGTDVDLLNETADGDLASAIALNKIDADATERKCICLVRGPSVVKQTELNFGSGTEADAIAALLALGILCQ